MCYQIITVWLYDCGHAFDVSERVEPRDAAPTQGRDDYVQCRSSNTGAALRDVHTVRTVSGGVAAEPDGCVADVM